MTTTLMTVISTQAPRTLTFAPMLASRGMTVYIADPLQQVGVHLVSSVPDGLLTSLVRCVVIHRVDVGARFAVIPRDERGAISPVIFSIAKRLEKPAERGKMCFF